MKGNKLILCLCSLQLAYAFMELYETEHAQRQLADDISDIAGITKAKELIDKMTDGVGGSTIAIHHPSGRQFIHRNGWIMVCNGAISKENGHCKGNALESVTAFRPEKNSDYCYIKNYRSVNETLCLSSHPVNVSFANDTIVCESATEFFPALAITIEDYLKMCERISRNVTYVYFANVTDPDRVVVPAENAHVKCDNRSPTNGTIPKSLPMKSRKIIKELRFAFNRSDVCVFTQNDKTVLNLLQYLKL